MLRGWYAIKHGFLQRKKLQQFLREPARQIAALAEITPERLDAENIAVLILDFDGVLANHDAIEPLPEVETWLYHLSHAIGQQRIAILTNKPHPARIHYFQKHFPLIQVVTGTQKKPYPEGILQVANYRGLPPHRVMLLDDRLLTGMLATVLSCSQGWYFIRPYVRYTHHPFKELFFSLLRITERGLFRYV